MRVVIDTNVLISALLSAKGAPALVLRLALEGKIDLVFSPQTVDEHWRVLHYSKIQKRLSKLEISMETAERALRHLVEISLIVSGKKRVAVIADDPSDNAFLACAAEGTADIIVSGDRHLKKLKTFEGIRILDPATFLDIISKPNDNDE